MVPKPPHIPYFNWQHLDEQALIERAEAIRGRYLRRRSCRFFSDKWVPEQVIVDLLEIASSAPSGANKQPWHFAAISSASLKSRIRHAAEEEERMFYQERATEEWLKDLAPLGTDWEKPFLETAPWLIVVFKEIYEQGPEGERKKHYYVNESVGIASGFLISAIHELGLVTLTHTPSPMNFLSEILERPPHQKPFLLLPVGYPAEDATVPNLTKKQSEDYSSFYRD